MELRHAPERWVVWCGHENALTCEKATLPRAGAIPLDGVDVEAISAGPNRVTQCAFRLTHPTFGARSLTLCAAGPLERDKWIHAIEVRRSGRGRVL